MAASSFADVQVHTVNQRRPRSTTSSMRAAHRLPWTYLCRDCVRRSGGRPSLHRPSSSLAVDRPASFASFFFHNSSWQTSAPAQRLPSGHRAPPLPPLTETIAGQAVDLGQYPPPPSVLPYRRTNVLTPSRLLKVYSELSKTRLTVLVVLTAMSGVALSPLPTTLPVLLSTAIGTALCSASANTLNQIQEVPFDAQMPRTRMRPLVRRAITPLHAVGFATATGLAGPAILWTMCNPTTALLGAANIALYAGAYTWLKRKSILNTWVGSVVGGIPPLMGWTACGGNILPSAEYPIHLFLPSFLASTPTDLALIDNPLAPWVLFLILYSWQFPHFNAISYLVRESYAQAGYRMLCVLSPAKNALVSLRHALLLIPICSVLVPLSGLTSWTFALVSLVPNVICARAAWQFWRHTTEKNAKKLWHYYLAYLPAVLGLMMVCKRGLDWGSWVEKEESKVIES
ncbi:UbiA prenyltransferase family-domain-containing protein [Fomitopsis serialis]|uniref:UbiA prenyltransferase family-domain-containing protein n=1 Tax=Fomitopsis serialis TaxID=139415 RepID=UPI00200819C5|nr:UbiA prenyltransferase family-domain-containing protein [Neoantrodia serialis]KAH9925544.1 UbiA prenyltransferase family-domain-containing protein [Neoantrodia serialis]